MSPHVKAQVLRFVRTSGLSFVALYLARGGQLSWASLWALGPGIAETLLRQWLPVKPIPAVASVLVPPAAPPGPPVT